MDSTPVLPHPPSTPSYVGSDAQDLVTNAKPIPRGVEKLASLSALILPVVRLLDACCIHVRVLVQCTRCSICEAWKKTFSQDAESVMQVKNGRQLPAASPGPAQLEDLPDPCASALNIPKVRLTKSRLPSKHAGLSKGMYILCAKVHTSRIFSLLSKEPTAAAPVLL